MRKLLLRILNFAVMPVPYPMAAGWHFLLGASLWWWLLYGAPTHYGFGKVLVGGGIGLIVGGLLVMVLNRIQPGGEE